MRGFNAHNLRGQAARVGFCGKATFSGHRSRVIGYHFTSEHGFDLAWAYGLVNYRLARARVG